MTVPSEHHEVDADGNSRRPLAAYATLVRLPNLFTAPPDVLLGVALVVAAGHAVSVGTVAGLAAASVLLYGAGTTLNDYFDAPEDARERRERPIPSGDVSRPAAVVFGGSLLAGGVAVAAVAGGATAGLVAGGVALAVLLYDGAFKGSTLGFLTMGACRGLNVLLGTTAAVRPTELPSWTLAVPAIVLLYIAGVTSMAESETGDADRGAVSTGVAGVAVAVLGLVGLLFLRSPPLVDVALSGALLVGFVAWTGRALRAAYADPSPGTIGPAVGTCVLGLVVLDAAFAAIAGSAWALAVLAFLVPAVVLSGVFDVT
ncbi:UbiA family prenyltransferase [Halorarum halophilum]|uniref:UbiA family prenyltransferase n=1 Tax=Halorarum halophilum TaxID=2743090 RepID=A0A7D5KLP1_9EURY|nr:UbiA family prenyltransferase [Halobaculum halophilum]QLG27695.1 UbiA family prenyltransferase [Halobaculum halophilum]